MLAHINNCINSVTYDLQRYFYVENIWKCRITNKRFASINFSTKCNAFGPHCIMCLFWILHSSAMVCFLKYFVKGWFNPQINHCIYRYSAWPLTWNIKQLLERILLIIFRSKLCLLRFIFKGWLNQSVSLTN